MDVEACSDCIDAHAKRVVDMYHDLKTPLKEIREADDESAAREVCEEWLMNAVKLVFSRDMER